MPATEEQPEGRCRLASVDVNQLSPRRDTDVQNEIKLRQSNISPASPTSNAQNYTPMDLDSVTLSNNIKPKF